MTTETTALTVLAEQNYALAQYSAEELKDVVTSNFQDEDLTPNDLDRVKMPSGGGKTCLIPTPDGEEEATKTIEGVIVAYRKGRVYWEESFEGSGGGNPPDCFSEDGNYGNGNPGGECKTCALNQFGSDKHERGKACKEMRLLYVLRPNSLLPIVVPLPPTSITPFKQYLQRLTSAAVRYSRVLTEIGLKEAQNKDNIKYSQATFKLLEKLDPTSVDHITAYSESFLKAFERSDNQ